MIYHSKALHFLIGALILLSCTLAFAQRNPKIQRKAKIEWSNIEAASGYIIEIRQGGTHLIKQETKNNYYETDLPHGVYQFRISVLNKNKEIETRTGWETVSIQSWKIVGTKYQYISLGWSYNIILPEWYDVLKYNPLAIHMHYAYELPQFNSIALEAYLEYEDFDNNKKNEEVNREMSVWSFAPGVCFYSKMNKYIDALFHVDGGLTYSSIDIDDRGDKSSLQSTDFFAMTALGLRFSYDMFFLEHGIGYKHIFYKTEHFKEVRPYLRAGVRF